VVYHSGNRKAEAVLTFLFWLWVIAIGTLAAYEFYEHRKNKDALDYLERYANDGDDS
jgi:hypothetical protein